MFRASQIYYEETRSLKRPAFNEYCQEEGIDSVLSYWYAYKFNDYETNTPEIQLMYIKADSIQKDKTYFYINVLDIPFQGDTTFHILKRIVIE